eukprot:8511109-Pyramimonas_sp.AAC.1
MTAPNKAPQKQLHRNCSASKTADVTPMENYHRQQRNMDNERAGKSQRCHIRGRRIERSD